MQLDRLLSQLTYEHVQGSQNREITDVCYHSGKVKEGSLFVCLKGQQVDGHDYLMDALRGGAAAVVLSAENTGEVPHPHLGAFERLGCDGDCGRGYEGSACRAVGSVFRASGRKAIHDRNHRDKGKDHDGVSDGSDFKRGGLQDGDDRYDLYRRRKKDAPRHAHDA